MRHGAACLLLCLIILSPWDVAGFGFIRDLLFPRTPTVTRVRHPEDARALGDEFAVLDTVGIVEQYGYPVEEHSVTTVDGYKIDVFRIYGSPMSPRKQGKPVVFLQSGLFASSDSWVLFGPGKDLAENQMRVASWVTIQGERVAENAAFLLADEGYDVWIGNMRGNSYGRSHTSLSPLTSAFWDFSFHEIATRDLPRMIDYVLEYTAQTNLSYIGTSMGTTIAFVLLSEIPEYNDKIRIVVCLAPVAFWKYPPKLVFRSSTDIGIAVRKIFDENGIYEIGPQTTNTARLGQALCSDRSLTQPLCKLFLAILVGDDPDQLNSTALPYIFSYFPAGGSTRTLYHYEQNIVAGSFQKYDFGYVQNFRLYGGKNPPMYDVKNVSAPVALIYGKNDILSLKANTDELAKRLPNVVTYEAVPYDKFNHFDFIWAKDGKKLLYDRVVELVDMYSK